jgi:hypothetical protein
MHFKALFGLNNLLQLAVIDSALIPQRIDYFFGRYNPDYNPGLF